MFTAGRYETPDLAGWTDGDFNDDFLFGSSDLIVALSQGQYADAALNAEMTTDPTEQMGGQVTLQYDDQTGNLRLLTDDSLSTFEIRSTKSGFNPDFANGFTGPFDIARADKLFRMDTGGFVDFDLGDILSPGLSADQLSSELVVDGSYAAGGRLTDVRFEMVPEPQSALLAAGGLLILAASRRRSQLL
jgi:hypothetical protein